MLCTAWSAKQRSALLLQFSWVSSFQSPSTLRQCSYDPGWPRSDPSHGLALCWLTVCKYSVIYVEVMNMRQQVFFSLFFFLKISVQPFHPPHPLRVSVQEPSSHRYFCLIAHESFPMLQETIWVLQTNTSPWRLLLIMETGPLLKVTDLSFSKLFYFVSAKYERVCEKSSVVFQEVKLKSLGMNINILCFTYGSWI